MVTRSISSSYFQRTSFRVWPTRLYRRHNYGEDAGRSRPRLRERGDGVNAATEMTRHVDRARSSTLALYERMADEEELLLPRLEILGVRDSSPDWNATSDGRATGDDQLDDRGRESDAKIVEPSGIAFSGVRNSDQSGAIDCRARRSTLE